MLAGDARAASCERRGGKGAKTAHESTPWSCGGELMSSCTELEEGPCGSTESSDTTEALDSPSTPAEPAARTGAAVRVRAVR